MKKSSTSGAKVLLLGDSGVGKSSLLAQMRSNIPTPDPPITVGCNIEVHLANSQMHAIEIWDIGGNEKFEGTRKVFYSDVDGLVLVHDLTNSKSFSNLQRWQTEVAMEVNFVGQGEQMPVLVVGTKLDKLSEQAQTAALESCGNTLLMNCLDAESGTPGSFCRQKFASFFNRSMEYRSSRLLQAGSSKSFSPAPVPPALWPPTPSARLNHGSPTLAASSRIDDDVADLSRPAFSPPRHTGPRPSGLYDKDK